MPVEAPPKPVKSRFRTERENFELTWTQLDTEFSTWRPHFQELSTFYLPRTGRFLSTPDRNKGGKKHNNILDNTGTRSVRILGAGLMAGATSPARPWFRVVTKDQMLNQRYSVKRWLDFVTKRILAALAASNFYRVTHAMYEELAVFGTAACIMLPDPDPRKVIHCYPLTIGEYRLATDYQGNVNTCYRTFTKTVAEVVGEFGKENCSYDVQQAFDNGFLQNAVQIRHVIEPRKDRDPNLADNLNMPWKSVYYEVGRNEDKFLRETGFERFPVLAPRWQVEGCDVYGHSPGMEALGDVKQLQHEQIRKGQGIDFQTLPPMLAPTAMRGQEMKWVPGGTHFVDSATREGGIRSAFEVKLDLGNLVLDIQDVRERIRGSFFADLFLLFARMESGSGRMTVPEIAERHEEKLIQLGPVLERLHPEHLAPSIENVYYYLVEAGEIPPPPPEMQNLELTLEFVSMIAQAQRAVGVVGIERALAIAGGVAGVKPDILDNLDEDELWAELSESIGVTPRISRSPDARTKLRLARLEAQKQVAQQAAAKTGSEITKNLAASPTTGDTALSDVISMVSGYNQPAPQVR